MIHTQETKQQVDSNPCCKHVSMSGKMHSIQTESLKLDVKNATLDRSKEVECWECNINMRICTPQLEKLF